jgi:alpha-tubulin suppressor-like RCC1 family protein
LWAWGLNIWGQLGLGNITYYSSPKQVGALTTWNTTACGRGSTFPIKTDGTLWTWGNNNFGQLGLGNTTNRSSPVQVGALTTWLNIAGFYQTIAITSRT